MNARLTSHRTPGAGIPHLAHLAHLAHLPHQGARALAANGRRPGFSLLPGTALQDAARSSTAPTVCATPNWVSHNLNRTKVPVTFAGGYTFLQV